MTQVLGVRWWWKLVASSLLALATAACGLGGLFSPAEPTVPPEFTDMSVLTDVPCASPCWYGLELGVSTKAEALATIEGLPFLDVAELYELAQTYTYIEGLTKQTAVGTWVFVSCKQPDGRARCAGIQFVQDIVVEIAVFPNFDISLGQLVTHVGDPDYLQILTIFSEGPFGPVPPCDIALVWKQRGIRAFSRSAGDCAELRMARQVAQTLLASEIYYMLPENSALADLSEANGDYAWAGFSE